MIGREHGAERSRRLGGRLRIHDTETGTKPRRQGRWYELERDDELKNDDETRRNEKGSRGHAKTVIKTAQALVWQGACCRSGLDIDDYDEHTGTDERR